MTLRGDSSTFRASGSLPKGAGANPAPRSSPALGDLMRLTAFGAAIVLGFALAQALARGDLRALLLALLPFVALLLALAVLLAAARRRP